jgi:hypothetical protein
LHFRVLSLLSLDTLDDTALVHSPHNVTFHVVFLPVSQKSVNRLVEPLVTVASEPRRLMAMLPVQPEPADLRLGYHHANLTITERSQSFLFDFLAMRSANFDRIGNALH